MSAKSLARVACIVLAPLSCVSLAFSADYPSRPITLVVPWSPGGASDIIGRTLAKELEGVLKQTVVVDNKAGAAGVIGAGFVAKASADGYTLLFIDSPHVINGSVIKKLPFDPVKSFVPVATVGKTPLALVVHPTVQAATLQEFKVLAQRDSKINLGSGGNGAMTHMVGELLQEALGVEITHVPFKGTAPAIQSVVSGQVQATMSTVPGILPYVRAGTLKALVVTSESRDPGLPLVPTMKEAGVANFVEYNWYGIVGPAGLPKEIVDKLNGAVADVLKRPDFQAKLTQVSVTSFVSNPAEMGAMMERDQKKWSDIARKHNIVAD